jgi:hypothetical protein
MSEKRKTIPFSNYGGYRRFCLAWWNELSRHLIGLSAGNPHASSGESHYIRWGLPGWMYDIYTFYHRGRYGWAPRDTWSLDHYLNGVLAGALWHLAEHTNGTPAGYPSMHSGTDETDHQQWERDLKRWATAFSEDPADVEIFDTPKYEKHHAEETRRRDALNAALREMTPWWEALWD